MAEMLIGNNVIIDDIEYVKSELEKCREMKIQDMEVVKKFIITEKYTMFYVDKKMKSSVTNDDNYIYVWLDTGFYDKNHHTLFLSLIRSGNEYKGHYVGTARILAENIKRYFPKYKKEIELNYKRFIDKYNNKCSERDNVHIEDEHQFLLSKINNDIKEEISEIELKILQLNVSWMEEPEEIREEAEAIEQTEKSDEKEQEITMGYLLDMLQEREQHIQELLENIEKSKNESNAKICDLVEIIKKQSSIIQEKKDALKRIRDFNEEESVLQFQKQMAKEEKRKAKIGHNLLNNRKKILVLGSVNLSTEVMKAIFTKEYGFDANDFLYETDYNKVVHMSERIIESNRYQAIIIGCCPHSTKGKGCWSSMIERCKQRKDNVLVVDARDTAGKLKVTKSSFRRALDTICSEIYKAA